MNTHLFPKSDFIILSSESNIIKPLTLKSHWFVYLINCSHSCSSKYSNNHLVSLSIYHLSYSSLFSHLLWNSLFLLILHTMLSIDWLLTQLSIESDSPLEYVIYHQSDWIDFDLWIIWWFIIEWTTYIIMKYPNYHLLSYHTLI
jgi:hypothetical protein